MPVNLKPSFIVIITISLGLILLITLLSKSVFYSKSLNGVWVWKPSDLKFTAEQDYLILYQGDLHLDDTRRPFISRGIKPRRGLAEDIGILIRLYKIEDPQLLADNVDRLIYQWNNVGTRIRELQLDFDSSSKNLANYAKFIDLLKKELHSRELSIDISITGLITWLEDNPEYLKFVANEVSYIAYQLYSNHDPLSHIKHYFPALSQIDHAYKIGITTSQKFKDFDYPINNNFKGEYVFINK